MKLISCFKGTIIVLILFFAVVGASAMMPESVRKSFPTPFAKIYSFLTEDISFRKNIISQTDNQIINQTELRTDTQTAVQTANLSTEAQKALKKPVSNRTSILQINSETDSEKTIIPLTHSWSNVGESISSASSDFTVSESNIAVLGSNSAVSNSSLSNSVLLNSAQPNSVSLNSASSDSALSDSALSDSDIELPQLNDSAVLPNNLPLIEQVSGNEIVYTAQYPAIQNSTIQDNQSKNSTIQNFTAQNLIESSSSAPNIPDEKSQANSQAVSDIHSSDVLTPDPRIVFFPEVGSSDDYSEKEMPSDGHLENCLTENNLTTNNLSKNNLSENKLIESRLPENQQPENDLPPFPSNAENLSVNSSADQSNETDSVLNGSAQNHFAKDNIVQENLTQDISVQEQFIQKSSVPQIPTPEISEQDTSVQTKTADEEWIEEVVSDSFWNENFPTAETLAPSTSTFNDEKEKTADSVVLESSQLSSEHDISGQSNRLTATNLTAENLASENFNAENNVGENAVENLNIGKMNAEDLTAENKVNENAENKVNDNIFSGAETALQSSAEDDSLIKKQRQFLEQVKTDYSQGRIAEAYRALSEFRLNLSNPKAEILTETNKILDCWAFPALYAPNKHQLEPAYKVDNVQPQTLQSVAEQYQITPELLRMINGLQIPLDAPLPNGQTLKVVRGPVVAHLFLESKEMIITFDGLYGGRFAFGIAQTVSSVDPTYRILGKIEKPEYEGVRSDGTLNKIPGGSPENPLGNVWMSLADGLGLHGTPYPEYIGCEDAPVGGFLFSNKDISDLNVLLPENSVVEIKY